MKKLPGDYDRKAVIEQRQPRANPPPVAEPEPEVCGGWSRARGWSRKRLVAMDQRYCEVMRAAWATRPAATLPPRPAARTDPGR